MPVIGLREDVNLGGTTVYLAAQKFVFPKLYFLSKGYTRSLKGLNFCLVK